ncbi:RCC1 repeat-containing protein [Myxococcus stipitatus DSM 14675]|uniref:RCC1 repeat-containing protein n=1 Tax=Myxococcus stipitatus (strain DSM 14675 / JCM 12634 / Mx s8) TaxID=1278073 RepID=L7UHS0_MYXSD|nr:chromosome condensation regulator [Myxococcus stipitatus]AGC47415.1 RCC1 repeat-containing protein [Myxococcus stipitatus DSM 14675]
MGAALPFVGLGTKQKVTTLSIGGSFTCALLESGVVKCWGRNTEGQLGLGDTVNRGAGPREMDDALAFVDLGVGRVAKALATGYEHACAILEDGAVKCWGYNMNGQLGLGVRSNHGDSQGSMGDALPTVNLGTKRTAKAITAGRAHSCAILDDGAVKCWGGNEYGQLGLGDKASRGVEPDEMGDALPEVKLGVGRTATAIAAGNLHTCAILDDGAVKCWGDNGYGRLGLGDKSGRGDAPGEMGDALPSVDLGTGRTAKAISLGYYYSCALLDDDTLKCWGFNDGILGLGDMESRGERRGQMGESLPRVNLGTGRTVKGLAAGSHSMCALLDDRWVKCWGTNSWGQLGLGDTKHRGGSAGEMGDALPVVEL